MTQATDEIPAKFYKYRSMSGDDAKWVERIVLHHEVFFAPASKFNDPFDLKPVFSLQASPERQREDFLRLSRKLDPLRTEEQRMAEADEVMSTSMNAENIDQTAAIIQALHTQVVTSQVGVFCVSTKCDDILMWSHYADSHKGICLEFDGTLAFMAHAQKVHYASERIPINQYDDSQEVMMEKALLTKSEHWSYESEWRLCRYEGGPGIVRFRPENLTGIVVGALASRATVETIRAWIRQRSSPVKLYRATTSNKRFELNIGPD